MPKPIQRKVGGEDKLPPIQRSAFSLQLEAMAAKQKTDFAALSVDAKKLHASMHDSERYEALTDEESGLIVHLKRDAKNTSFRMASAVANYNAIRERHPPFEGEVASALASNAGMVHDLWLCTMALATIGHELAGQINKIVDFEAEAEVLGAKIMDDSNLPNFAELDKGKDIFINEQAKKATELSEADLALLAPDQVEAMGNEKVPDYAKVEPFVSDAPIRWGSHYENNDTVMAPTENGARAMIAMRIRKTIKDDQVAVWQIDEHGNRIVDFSKAG